MARHTQWVPDRCRLGRQSCLPTLAFFLILFAAAVAPALGSPRFRAQWRDREIQVDGNYRDWEGKLFQFEDQKIYAGLMEDESNFYVCFSTSDRTRM